MKGMLRGTFRKQCIVLCCTLLAFLLSFAQTNAIKQENALTGNPSSEWDISGAGSSSIQGFATDISVNKGQRINFKINTSSAFTYTIKIYRLGYYQGNGARLITTLGTNYTGVVQPAPISNSTGIVDCGNWSISAFWDVPATAVSGYYIAKLTRNSSSSTSSHIVFIVRDDASHSDLFFQASDATWQAYNNYGGNSLYIGTTSLPGGHASKVSYNRPFLTRNGGGGGGASEDWLFNAEYPMIRFLERNGYDVTYTTDVDAARRGNLILNHKVYLSVGHDEYWSAEQRANVESARNAGINIAFFSGNEVYWKTRWENSVDGSNTSYRTLVCYKEGTLGESVCGGKCDPTATWTGLWRDGCNFPAGGGCLPENALSGQISWDWGYFALKVPSTYKNLRFWRNTSIASLANNATATLPGGTLGYEWNWEQYPNSYPQGRFTLSSTTMNGHTHKLSLYRHSSGALVFGAGTVQWAWGLDANHDNGGGVSTTSSIDMQQATINLLADMSVQPTSLMSGLVVASASSDITKPLATITFPANGASVTNNTTVTITGTASDVGGVVAAVEISLDGGVTWLPANGTSNWSYSWTPTILGNYVIKVRGIDDSGNIGDQGTPPSSNAINVTVPGTLLFTSTSPFNFTTGVSTTSQIKASFNENINSSTITSTTFQLLDENNNPVANVNRSVVNNQIILTPSTSFAQSTKYTVIVKGGLNGIKSSTGNILQSDSSWVITTADPSPLAITEGPGGPILVISNSANSFSRYPVEILRAEGLNEFNALDISAVNAGVLNNYDVVILGEISSITTTQATMFSDWVNAGGTLIAFRPPSQLYSLLGITKVAGTSSDKYLLINTASGPGSGLVATTIQYHGTSDQYTLNGASSLATLYSSATTATSYQAVTTRDVGSAGGKAIAFSFDLAKSIIYTRQGNPQWESQDRDGDAPIRSDDLFFGSPNWIDFNKIAIPQADEQQRLLANIILQGNLHKKPLPRFWYLPRSLKAAIVMTGDDHANNGTMGRFDKYLTLGPNTSDDYANWNTIRSTSYIYANTSMTNQQAIDYQSKGFEIALHPNTDCFDYPTMASLENTFSTQLGNFAAALPGLPSPVTSRTHCLLWSDWASTPKVEVLKGMRLDATYYYYPQSWMQNIPGMFTGSGMPMRFADKDGSMIDCYQLTTQMTDETNMNYTSFCNALLDKATGPEGYYGVFCANMHTDLVPHAGSDAIIASALQRQIPIVSSKQMLEWLDGRNNSFFSSINWTANQLNFTVTARSGARNLKGMLPLFSQTGTQLISLSRNGSSTTFTTETIKGMQYAFFDGKNGNYIATYGAPTTGTINGTIVLQGRPTPPNSQWVVPIQVELYVTGNPIPVVTFNTTTNSTGQFTVVNVPTGTYNIKIKNLHTLARVKIGQTIIAGNNNINFGVLLEGDANNDNNVDPLDVSLLLNSFYKSFGEAGFDARADLNGDNTVDPLDVSLLLNNFYQSGETP